MTELLKEAIAEVSTLPEAAQEKIGEELLLHVEKLRRLRENIDEGIQSLQQGDDRELHIAEVIKRARALHEES